MKWFNCYNQQPPIGIKFPAIIEPHGAAAFIVSTSYVLRIEFIDGKVEELSVKDETDNETNVALYSVLWCDTGERLASDSLVVGEFVCAYSDTHEAVVGTLTKKSNNLQEIEIDNKPLKDHLFIKLAGTVTMQRIKAPVQ